VTGRWHLRGESEARERRLKVEEVTLGCAETSGLERSFDKSAFNILEVVDQQVAGLY